MSALAIILPLLRRFWPYAGTACFALLAWHFHASATARAAALRTQAAQFAQAQNDAATAAAQALHQQEALYQAKARETQNAYAVQLADARTAADRYIADHRLRSTTDESHAGPTAAGPQSSSPAIPSDVPAEAVVVSGNDVQACTAAVTYALEAHDWAASLTP